MKINWWVVLFILELIILSAIAFSDGFSFSGWRWG